MSAVRTSLAALLLLAGCGGTPFPSDGGGGGGTSNTSVSDLPGTTGPKASGAVSRHERQNTGTNGGTVTGNGFAFKNGKINYDSGADTFTVSNLAFDGSNVYQHTDVGGAMGNDAGPARVFAADSTDHDATTGAVVDQFSYRALYGVSTSGNTHFAIVRTGAYANYGFGGFIYDRKGGMTLPTSRFAQYNGHYAGLRDSSAGGLQYTTGDMQMNLDLSAFEDEDPVTRNKAAIDGYVTNRRIFDLAGNDITDSVLLDINADKNSAELVLPTLHFAVGPGVLDNNGEAMGSLSSQITVDGALQTLEAGKYYAVLSGDGSTEVAGVIVVISTVNSVDFRETGGFILYRP